MNRVHLSLCGALMGIALPGLATCSSDPDETETCIDNDHTVCASDVVYWVDSCGKTGLVAEICTDGCNADYTGCEGGSCTPDCPDGVICGDDGCGGVCGTCGDGTVCQDGSCEPCTPDCAGKVCGDDGCGDVCGTCDDGESCEVGQCVGSESNVLVVDCDVPYVLDAAQVSDMAYMTLHFDDLEQEYCITGSVNGVPIHGFPEKMYYGQHDAGSTLSLVQVSMLKDGVNLVPQWSVKIDFNPDSQVTDGAVWPVAIGGLNNPEAYAGLIKHLGTTAVCLQGIGTAGQLSFSSVVGVEQVEGGSFHVSGSFTIGNPWDISDYCSQTPPELPCCT